MASTSNVPQTQVPQATAKKLADDWEEKVTRLIEEGDKDTWANAQRGLYDELVS